MVNVQFEETHPIQNNFENPPKGMVGWVIKASNGKITTPEQASIVLLFATVLILALTGIIFFKTTRPPENNMYVDPITGGGLVPGKIPGTF